MRKNLLRLPMGLLKIIGTKNAVKHILLALVILLITLQTNAQGLSPQAQEQIKFLMTEKASRTPAQKKIATNILLTYKMQNDRNMKSNLPDLKFDEVKINAGKIKVDITVAVSAQVLNALKALGCEIIFSSEKFASITANIPLNKIEQIAALDAVKHIALWMAPITNGQLPDAIDTTGKPGFSKRTAKVKDYLSDVIGQKGSNINTVTTNAIGGAGSVISEAVATHKADLVQANFGIKGAGVKIGVISNGVDGYAISQASGDLPPVINILPGQAGSASEGRAMMELIHDIAPDAQLYFATALISQASFAQNILDLRAAGCDIIVDDISYYAEGVFQDDNVARSINTVTASGALYFSSAGNSGNKNDNTAGVWEGDFVSGGPITGPIANAGETGLVHDFGGGTVYNVLPTASGSFITLKWSDPLGQSANDYDLFATNAAGTTLTAFSAEVQNGAQNPYEIMTGRPAGERIYIVLFSGAARALHLNTNRGTLSISTPGVIYGHNAAASAYTVAATPAAAPFYTNFPQGPYPNPFNAANVVEGFSSDGPRRIFFNPDGSPITPGNLLFATNGGTLLQKTDITAADGCATNTPGFQPFYGTSAAAPNAAAIAALVKSAVPGITPAQIRSALISSAIDIETPGVDRDAGAGIIMAREAVIAAGFSIVAIAPSSPVTITAENAVPANNKPDPGETLTVNLPLINVGTTNAANLTATLLATGGVTNPGSPQNYGVVTAEGASVERPFTFTAVGNCGDNITLTLALQDGAANLGTITYTLQLGATGPLNTPQGFSNNAAFVVPGTGTGAVTGAPASLYSSDINVSGLTGKTAKVTVTLKQFNHTWPGDVDILLVSPSGKKMVILSDVDEGGTDVVNANIVLDDDAAVLLPPALGFTSGSFKPTNYGTGDAFPSPAPAAPYLSPGTAGAITLNSAFGGDDPNGIWKLFVVDDTNADAGNINGGWDITITTVTDNVCSVVPPTPLISLAASFATFEACEGSPSPEQNFTVGGSNLTDDITVTAPAGFEVSLTPGNGFGNSVSLTPVSGTVNSTTVYVVKAASTPNNISGIITVASDGAATQEPGISGVTNAATTWYADIDGDGYGDDNSTVTACEAPANYVAAGGDCDDQNAATHPGAPEVCDGMDNDCDGQIDEDFPLITYYFDVDGDGYGSPNNPVQARCFQPINTVTNNLDCDDQHATVYPGAPELCDGMDNDCDGQIDEDFPLITYYFDVDGDSYGSPNNPVQARCFQPTNTVTNNLDCDDQNAAVHPGVVEICGNGIDDNCNGQVDEGCTFTTQVGVLNAAKKEGGGQNVMKITVRLNKKSTQQVKVNYITQNMTAIAGSDYIATSGTVTFAPGVIKQTISVTIKGDHIAEPDETFKVVLSSPVNATIAGAYSTSVGTIINDDGGSIVSTPIVQASSLAQATTVKTVKISPNPANTTLYVQLNGYNGNVTLQLRSMEGRVLRQEKLQAGNVKTAQHRMNVSDLATGTYFLMVIDENGNSKVEKVLIAR